MAPIQLEQEVKYGTLALVATPVIASFIFTVGVGRSLLRSYRGLGPSQDTRERRAHRENLIPVFATLALVSAVAALYTALQHAVLSYKVWIALHNEEIPNRPQGTHGLPSSTEYPLRVYIARWLSTTPIFLDTVEILSENARRFWWAQQVDLGLVLWNLFLSIEGRRRNIPLLWCYSLLGQTVSLAYSQSLFFIALLLTPAPLPPQADGLPVARYVQLRDSLFPPKPNNWTPHPVLSLISLILNVTLIHLKTIFANTPLLKPIVLGGRLLLLAPLSLTYIVPEAWGTIHDGQHGAYNTYTYLFKNAAVASFALHIKATLSGLLYHAPDAYFHRHSKLLLFDIEQRSAWERTTSAFGRVLGATSDHPVVRGVGWDVLLSALTIGLWAALRGIEVRNMLVMAVPTYEREEKPPVEETSAKRPDSRGSSKSSKDGQAPEGTVTRRRGRPRKTRSPVVPEEEDYKPPPSLTATAPEGDVVPADPDWESSALTWGLTVIGGLGLGSAGVLGGECIAR